MSNPDEKQKSTPFTPTELSTTEKLPAQKPLPEASWTEKEQPPSPPQERITSIQKPSTLSSVPHYPSPPQQSTPPSSSLTPPSSTPSTSSPHPQERKPRARGTAAMDPQTRREVARKGGLAVSRNKQHMAEIGRKGGQSVSKNREHMAQIGRKGGAASRGHRSASRS